MSKIRDIGPKHSVIRDVGPRLDYEYVGKALGAAMTDNCMHQNRAHPNSPHTPPHAHNPHYVEIVPGIFVGDRYACDLFSHRFDRVVHIWRNDYPDHSCNHVVNKTSKSRDLVIDYADGRSLVTESNPPLEGIENFLRDIKPVQSVLIHCAAGQTRSNTIAFLALMVFGLDVGNAMGLIIGAQWKERRLCPNFCVKPLSEILYRFSENV